MATMSMLSITNTNTYWLDSDKSEWSDTFHTGNGSGAEMNDHVVPQPKRLSNKYSDTQRHQFSPRPVKSCEEERLKHFNKRF